jgi:hypothetical protein
MSCMYDSSTKYIYAERALHGRARTSTVCLRDSYPGTAPCTTCFGAGCFAPPLVLA